MPLLSALRRRLPFLPQPKPLVALVHLAGVIASDARPGRGLSIGQVEKPLRKAFAAKPKAVVLTINSPGGAPAQSRMIHDRARALSVKHDVPVLTYIEDVGASGGYMIALAGEDILADPFAIVGSIGVIAAGFGFHDAIARLGIERRVHTAGENKSQLDPFRPEQADDVARLKDLLTKSHKLFAALVRDRRAGRLTDEEDVFDGRFWLAGDALALGLIDEVGDLPTMLKARYGDDVRMKRYSTEGKGIVSRLLSGRSSSDPLTALLDAAERRADWARFGL
ncbi:S49 family peptidase [Parvularcula dongshanensis]|uniref:Serine protease SohB n=1 Tax=Parvularcula dongshanensis TaxID=1173995 RepID=A0A840I5A9_9PROT|nr:S49 family peptidase [Parvularcula dongshanensis]MBB4660029.1 serine protease SohB [Parvularcula dongshanensis]